MIGRAYGRKGLVGTSDVCLKTWVFCIFRYVQEIIKKNQEMLNMLYSEGYWAVYMLMNRILDLTRLDSTVFTSKHHGNVSSYTVPSLKQFLLENIKLIDPGTHCPYRV